MIQQLSLYPSKRARLSDSVICSGCHNRAFANTLLGLHHEPTIWHDLQPFSQACASGLALSEWKQETKVVLLCIYC